MSTSRHIDKICIACISVTLILALVLVSLGKNGALPVSADMGYESRLFDTSRVHEIDVRMDDWNEFLETCENEEYRECSVVIDGETYKNVGIRAKGNTSLSSVKKYGNDRYSFKIEFDCYDPGISYYGLDKISLNNIIQDHTYMKDYLCYQMMNSFDVAAPLCSYAYITVNGEDWGLYLAVEAVEESFLERNYGNDYGELYKPDSMDMGGGRGNGGGFEMSEGDSGSGEIPQGEENQGPEPPEEGVPQAPQEGTAPDGGSGRPEGMEEPPGDMSQFPGGMEEPSEGMDQFSGGMEEPPGDVGQFPGGMEKPLGDKEEFPGGMEEFSGDMEELPEGNMPEGEIPETGNMPQTDDIPRESNRPGNFPGNDGMPGRDSKDVSLIYTDDSYESYSNIFENAKTDITDSDKDRLISSLKKLNEGTDIEETVDIEQVIRYFAVHNFVCNFDSYTGSMIHNYYLYEKDGQMAMIPWDYNLAFGGFESGTDAKGLINYPVDTPVSGGEASSRPMLAWIFENEEYTEMYHEYFDRFIEEYFESGYFSVVMEEVSQMIAPYVEKDPTKFCTYEEFEAGIEALGKFCLLRAESIKGQIDGTIPSTNEGQKADSSALIEVEAVNIEDMGSMHF